MLAMPEVKVSIGFGIDMDNSVELVKHCPAFGTRKARGAKEVPLAITNIAVNKERYFMLTTYASILKICRLLLISGQRFEVHAHWQKRYERRKDDAETSKAERQPVSVD
jgi:hypothetical protein